MPILLTLLLALAVAGPATPAPASTDTPSPTRMLGLIRAKFRSHRPPPPYVVYTIERKQNISEGYPDYLESYTYHVWLRSSDRGALARKVYRDYFRGFLEFQRPAFNEARDPGPRPPICSSRRRFIRSRSVSSPRPSRIRRRCR